MTIRNLDSYTRALWDWGFLDVCFQGTGIKVSDVDGIVERGGQFLLIEAKGPGKFIPRGQSILFQQLYETGLFTPIVIWGEPNKPEVLQVWPSAPCPCTTEDVQMVVRGWFIAASSGERIPR